MDHLERMQEKMRQGQKAVSAARQNLKAMGAEEALDRLAAAQAHIDQASKSLQEKQNLLGASWHLDQASLEINKAIDELRS